MFKSPYKKIIFLLLFLSYSIYGKDVISLYGSVTKILNDGKREKFSNLKIYLKNNPKISTQTWSQGNFSFKNINKFPKVGEQIQLKVIDDKWFILSPFNGILNVPKKKKNVDILLISKSSTIYLTLFAKVDYYTIQVLSVNNERGAIEMVNNLRNDCIVAKKTLKYCQKNIYYTSHLRNGIPNNGYVYKVNFEIFQNKKDANKDLNFVRSKYKMKDSFIKIHNKFIEL